MRGGCVPLYAFSDNPTIGVQGPESDTRTYIQVTFKPQANTALLWDLTWPEF